MFQHRPRRILPLLSAALVLAAAGSAFAAPTPAPTELQIRLNAHRQAEASAKARLVAASLDAEKAAAPVQGFYDVHHYDLDLDLSPSTHTLTGTVTVGAEVVGATLSTMALDLDDNMTVSAATSGGLPATFVHAGGTLNVTLDRTYAQGEAVSVGVSYAGDPSGDYFGWDSFDSQPMIWTLSEPFGAREWWPCKDLNTDKADSVDIRVTVPDGLIVASNGLLESEVDNGATRTFHWATRYPIATYLVSLAIHPYIHFSDAYTPLAGGDPMPLEFYVFPSHYGAVQTNYALTKDMIGVFAQAYGEYPFVDEKYGHAEFNWGGGMEHQTLTSLGGWSPDLISHELAHQWWGDMVTCADFHHIWLNEGFATWSEAYWVEQAYGEGIYRDYMEAAAFYGTGTIYVEDTSDVWGIFDWNLSYNKSSWVVHMLRGVLGDDDFFASLAAYRAAHEFGTAVTEDLRDICEAVSGRDLDAFFEQWIYGAYYPQYVYNWTAGPVGDYSAVDLTIGQVQTNAGVFTMPIDVRVLTSTGTYDFTVENDAASRNYILPVDGDVLAVTLDPDDWILCTIEAPLENPTFTGGMLLVNGYDLEVYGDQVAAAFADSVFSGGLPFTFWDARDEPAGGYPAGMPAPAGHGPIPAGVLGLFSSVVWTGADAVDLAAWDQTRFADYLTAGGNLLLLAPGGRSYLDGPLDGYLGVSWDQYGPFALGDCRAALPGLVDLPFAFPQSGVDGFAPGVTGDTVLLFADETGVAAPLGVGALVRPPLGASFRPRGGRLAYVGGSAAAYQPDALKQDLAFLLANEFDEPYTHAVTAVSGPPAAAGSRLLPNHPNPFNPRTVVPFAIADPGRVEIAVFDAAGRRVRTLLADSLPAGPGSVVWDGVGDAGRPLASGTYFVRLSTAQGASVRPMTLVR